MHIHATEAQLARTLAASTQPGTAQVAWGAHPFRVRHSVDGEGRPLLLCRTDGALDRTLRPADGESDTAAVLCVTASSEAEERTRERKLGPQLALSEAEERTRERKLGPQLALPGGRRGSLWPISRVWISGWVEQLAGAQARDAALEFAAVNPLSDLLGIGSGQTLYRMDVAEVRLECPGGHLREIDPADYAAAEPLRVFAHGSAIPNEPVM